MVNSATKTIWYVRDIATQGADFYLWDTGPDAEQKARTTFVGLAPDFQGEDIADLFEMGSAIVPVDYEGEPLPNQED